MEKDAAGVLPAQMCIRDSYYLEVQTMSKTILIIEDEEAIQSVVKAFLEDEGYNVCLLYTSQ